MDLDSSVEEIVSNQHRDLRSEDNEDKREDSNKNKQKKEAESLASDSVSKLKTHVARITPKKAKFTRESNYDPTKLEDSPAQVLERFKLGCECQDDQCFKGLDPETVYRHRLNIADLTKAEHDMYLMGVTMACLANPYETAKRKERRRLRAHYVYQGRRVCLDAFLYLENCTHYQIKRIRKHLIMHGVSPRVHGNQRKMPHNTFSLDIYKIATEFFQNFLNEQKEKQRTKGAKHTPLHLLLDITCKTVYNLYMKYCKKVSPNVKILGYSTFRGFLKVQFPQVKFAKSEYTIKNQPPPIQRGAKPELRTKEKEQTDEVPVAVDIVAGDGTLVPVVFPNETMAQDNTYFLTLLNETQDGLSYQITADGLLVNRDSLPVTVTKANAS